MPFSGSQENDQEETVLPPTLRQSGLSGSDPQYYGLGLGQKPSIGARIMQMARQGMSIPQDDVQKPAPGVIGQNWGNGQEQWNLSPRDDQARLDSGRRASVGQRILRLSPKPDALSNASFMHAPKTRESNWAFGGQPDRNTFETFIPAGTDPSLNLNPRSYSQTDSYIGGNGGEIGGTQGGKSAVDLRKQQQVRSKIPKPSSLPTTKPPRLPDNPTEFRRRLSRLMTGIRGSAMTPVGVAPSGALMRDISGQVKAPSRIPRQYESGENFSNINIDLIKGNEGGTKVHGYVPPKAKHGTRESGVTIAAGFDVGQHNLTDLRSLGLSKDLTNKLAPFVELTGQAAKDALKKNPLTITTDEAEQINSVVLNSKLNAAAAQFNQTSNGQKFSELPWQAQTAIGDLWYNMGQLNSPRVARRFWQQVTTGDWEAAYQNLNHFSGKDPTLARRAKRDGKLLRDAIDIGKLPTD